MFFFNLSMLLTFHLDIKEPRKLAEKEQNASPLKPPYFVSWCLQCSSLCKLWGNSHQIQSAEWEFKAQMVVKLLQIFACWQCARKGLDSFDSSASPGLKSCSLWSDAPMLPKRNEWQNPVEHRKLKGEHIAASDFDSRGGLVQELSCWSVSCNSKQRSEIKWGEEVNTPGIGCHPVKACRGIAQRTPTLCGWEEMKS